MTDWMLAAACQGDDVDRDWWSSTPELALHICRRHCEVRAQCDQWASGQQWHGLVVGGWLRPEGFHGVRAQQQPDESSWGCPTCRPGTVAESRQPVERERQACIRCKRSVPLHPNGTPMRHKYDGRWCE